MLRNVSKIANKRDSSEQTHKRERHNVKEKEHRGF